MAASGFDGALGRAWSATNEAILDAATVPIGTVAIYQAIERVKHPEDPTAGCRSKSPNINRAKCAAPAPSM